VPADSASARTAVARVTRRLIPFLFLLYILAFLDRVNVGFAALEMNQALGFGPAVYGLGAGMFFLGYCLFEVPSNLVLYRTGARVWIARIMITWGLAASAMILVRTPWSFYLLRFLLGVAEAGFFPGIIFYLTHWYPARDRARAYSWFLAAIPVSGIVGGPLSGALLGLDGRLGLQGWQWLFLLEGIPSAAVGLLVLVLLPERPADARWLAPEERASLESALAAERADVVAEHGASLGRALVSPRVWWLGTVYFLIVAGLYAFSLWLPQLVKGSGTLSNLEVGAITAVPYLVAAAGMVLVGGSSDRSGERHLHLAAPALAAAAGFVAVAFVRAPVPLIAALSVAAFGLLACLGPFWALPTAFLKGEAGAGGIALINSMGALGGFVGPYLLGVVKDRTGSFTAGLLLLGAMVAVAAGIVLGMRRGARERPKERPA
jgi:ACS family tartrate transporter-like MFS transporter